MSHHHILICWSLIRNGSLLLLYNVQPQVLNLYLKVILVASMSNFTVVEVHTIILDFSRSRFLSTFVKKHPGIHHKINNFKVGPIKSLLRIRWSAVSMCNPWSPFEKFLAGVVLVDYDFNETKAVFLLLCRRNCLHEFLLCSYLHNQKQIWISYLIVTKVKVDWRMSWLTSYRCPNDVLLT